MKISISNIIWEKGENRLEDFFKVLESNKVTGVELALSCFWEEPTDVEKSKIDWLKNLLEKHNLTISALHSITYTRPDLTLFESDDMRNKLFDYILKYVYLAKELKCKNIVFGSPNSRKLNGKNLIDCNKIFLDELMKLDNYLGGIYFNIEPLHTIYCDYLNNLQDVHDLLKDSNFKNIKIQLDVRTIIENAESINEIEKYFEFIKHCQVSDPSLTLSYQKNIEVHKLVSDKLKMLSYNGFVSGEYLYNNSNNRNEYLVDCIRFLKLYYE
jgi:sugar phosphate isomerase/epimerase